MFGNGRTHSTADTCKQGLLGKGLTYNDVSDLSRLGAFEEKNINVVQMMEFDILSMHCFQKLYSKG